MWVVYWKATTIHCKALSQQSNIVHCQMRHKEGKDKQILIVYTMHGMPKCTCQTELASIIKLALYIVYLAANPVSQSVSRLVSHSANLKRFIATYHMWTFHNILSAEFHKFMKIWVWQLLLFQKIVWSSLILKERCLQILLTELWK